MTAMNELLSMTFLGNTLLAWSLAIGAAAATLFVLLLARRFVRHSARRMAGTEQQEILEVPAIAMSRTAGLFILITAIVLGLQLLVVPERLRSMAISAFTIAAFWQAGLWLTTAAAAWLERKRRTALVEDRAAAGSFGIIGFAARVLIWSLAVLLTLDNLGVNITALVAGLGIGGIAIALAVQNVLGDLLASLSITLDKPFVIGDFLTVGDFLGTVEYIGIKSTRLRSLSGEQIVLSNADLLGSRIRNYGRMFERRVVFTLGVTYETPREKLRQLPKVLRAIVEEEADTRFDRSHFAKYGPASLDFEVVYYVLSPDYNRYMDIQQSINLRIHEEFERLGVEFAYPTQKVWLAKIADGAQ
jgi:small-conductance mechanosensitive channel